jgi:hypothetical protein
VQFPGPEEQAGDHLSPHGSLRSPFSGIGEIVPNWITLVQVPVPPSGKLPRSARSACVALPGAVTDTVLASGLGYKARRLPAGRWQPLGVSQTFPGT